MSGHHPERRRDHGFRADVDELLRVAREMYARRILPLVERAAEVKKLETANSELRRKLYGARGKQTP